MTSPFSSQEVSLHSLRIRMVTPWKEDDCLPIIHNSRQTSGVSLSPRRGRNERSEWRTVRRTVDRRGGAAPSVAEQQAPLKRHPTPNREQSGFQVHLIRARQVNLKAEALAEWRVNPASAARLFGDEGSCAPSPVNCPAGSPPLAALVAAATR